jgi:pectinesterase
MALQQGQEVAAVDAVVAKDGSGDFTTITSAVDAAPQNSMSRHVIRVAKGVYDEIVRVPDDLWNVTLLGDGIGVTVVTGSRAHSVGCACPWRCAHGGMCP